jgi:hypothetical protein
LADFLVPHEYGIEVPDKLNIGRTTCKLLLESIWKDLQQMQTPIPDDVSTDDTCRLHIYCGSESHLQPLRNVLFQSNVVPINCSWDCYNELNYLTHVVFKLYRYDDDVYQQHVQYREPPAASEQYYIELDWSPGVIEDVFAMAEDDHALPCVEAFPIHPHVTLDEMRQILVNPPPYERMRRSSATPSSAQCCW